MTSKHSIEKELTKLFNKFFLERNFDISVKCLELYNAYNPNTDEVAIYKYKVHIIIEDKLYVYDGWCYEEDLKQVALGIFSNWLVKNYKLNDGPSTVWCTKYTCFGNLIEKDKKEVA